ncbi:MAG TPA: hypothetical protein VHE14_06970 [Solirubrobacteraceae bacterium]|nr:hypothetical protein [Solirubrobacteraceae bacterium]
MLRRLALTASVVLVAGGIAGAAPATAGDNTTDLFKDCLTNGSLTQQYSKATLEAAKQMLTPNTRPYAGNCPAAIDRALAAANSATTKPKRAGQRRTGQQRRTGKRCTTKSRSKKRKKRKC